MKLMNPLPFVEDVEKSRRFCSGVLGLSIIQDHGNFVMFEGGLLKSWKGALSTSDGFGRMTGASSKRTFA